MNKLRKTPSILLVIVTLTIFAGLCNAQTIVYPPCNQPLVIDAFGFRCVCADEKTHLGRSVTGQPTCTNISTYLCPDAQNLCPEQTYFKRDDITLTSDCLLCQVENCANCNTNPKICEVCLPGFYLSNGTCKNCPYGAQTCKADPTNASILIIDSCFKPTQTPTNKCFCPAGQYESPQTKECVTTPATNLPGCPSGTVLDQFSYAQGVAYRCLPCGMGQAACVFSPNNVVIAGDCRPGFFKNGDVCQMCGEYCLACTGTADACTICKLAGAAITDKCACPLSNHEDFNQKTCIAVAAGLNPATLCPPDTLFEVSNPIRQTTRCTKPNPPIPNCQMLYKPSALPPTILCEMCLDGFIKSEDSKTCVDCAERCGDPLFSPQCTNLGWAQYDTTQSLCRQTCFLCPKGMTCGVGLSGRVEPNGCTVSGTYFDPIAKICRQCDAKCLTCSEPTKCQTCKSSTQQVPNCDCAKDTHFNGQACVDRQTDPLKNCPNTLTAFYIDPLSSVSFCVPCQLNQLTCKAIDRVKTSPLTCGKGFWLAPILTITGAPSTESTCQPCDPKCTECSTSPTTCTICANGQAAPQCSCLATEFFTETGGCVTSCIGPTFVPYQSSTGTTITQFCFVCNPRTTCSSCGVEPVPAAFLDPAMNGGMVLKSPLDPNQQFTLYCKECNKGQFVGQSRLCEKCGIECSDCTISGCTSCAPNRTNPPRCSCQPGTHFDGNVCITRNTVLEANCPADTFQDPTGATIVVTKSYFEDIETQVSYCVKCKPMEKTCRAVNLFETVARSCKDGFYFKAFATVGTNTVTTMAEGTCEPCDAKCKSCTDASTCLSCSNGKTAPSCSCLAAEWIRFDGSCSATCDLKTSVEFVSVRNNVPIKYCFECQTFYGCDTCKVDSVDPSILETDFPQLGGKVIFVANNQNDRFVVGCKSCKPGQWLDNITQRNCIPCAPKCATCGTSGDQCLTCTLNRDINVKCECQTGFFENSAGICEQLTGTNPTITCPAGTLLFQSADQKITKCLSCGWGVNSCTLNPNVNPLDPLQIPVTGVCREGLFNMKIGRFGQFLSYAETPNDSDGSVDPSQIDATKVYIPYSYCARCSFQCETCRDGPENCLTCKAGRVLTQTTPPRCICPFLTHENFKTKLCEPIIKDRVYFDRLKYGKELCPIGTAYIFDDRTVNSKCILCPNCCSECDIDPTSIQSTTSGTTSTTAGQTVPSLPKFKCAQGTTEPGTFFDYFNQACPQCDFRCKSCFEKPTQCRSCSSDLRDLTKNCACKSGYSENPSTNECVITDTTQPPQASCPSPFVFVPIDSTSFKCEKCVDGCGFCYFNIALQKPTCEKCSEGFAPFQSTTGTAGVNCLKCPDNCVACQTDGVTTKCFQPAAGFYLKSGGCTPNCDNRCATCNKYSDLCLTCGPNRELEPICKCQADFLENPITNVCEQVSKPSTGQVLSCPAGQTAIPDATGAVTCKACESQGCENCVYNFVTKMQECLKCSVIGFAYDPTTKSCSFHGGNIQHYQLCDQPGQFPILDPSTKTWACFPCPKSCASCSVIGSLKCLKCQDSFAPDSTMTPENPCRKCGPTCRTCLYDSASKTEKCTSCRIGEVIDPSTNTCINRLNAEPKCTEKGLFPAIDLNSRAICRKCWEQSKNVAACTFTFSATGQPVFAITECETGYSISTTTPPQCIQANIKCPPGCLLCKTNIRGGVAGSTSTISNNSTKPGVNNPPLPSGSSSNTTVIGGQVILSEIICTACDISSGFTNFNGYCKKECGNNEFFNPKATADGGACQACPANCAVCNFNPLGVSASPDSKIPLALCLTAISNEFYIKAGIVYKYQKQCSVGEASDPVAGCRPCPTGCSACSLTATGDLQCDICATGFDKIDSKYCGQKTTVCDPGHTNVFDENTQSYPCVKCSDQIKGCNHCLYDNFSKQFQCYKCEASFYSIPKRFDEVYCVDGTIKTEIGSALQFSWDGTDIKTAKVETIKCDVNCMECQTNFGLYPNNTLSLPPKCSQCAVNFKLNAQGTFCGGQTKCEPGFYLAQKDDFSFCAKCPDSNAKSCTLAPSTQTTAGTTNSNAATTMIVQSDACINDTFEIVSGKCTPKNTAVSCQQGLFRNQNNQCVECITKFPLCTRCSVDQCLECPRGTVLANDSISCVKVTTKKLICGGNSTPNENNTACICPSGLFYDDKLSNCQPTQCSEGSYMSITGGCSSCAHMNSGFCVSCNGPDKQNCQRCARGQRLNPSTYECESCGENCEQCNEKGCLRCSAGLFFEINTENNLGRCVVNCSKGYVVLVDTIYRLNPENFGADSWLTTPDSQIDDNDFSVAIGSQGVPIVDNALVPLDLDLDSNFIASVKQVKIRAECAPCRKPCQACAPTHIFNTENKSCLASRNQCPYSTVMVNNQLICKPVETFTLRAQLDSADPKGIQNADKDLVIFGKINKNSPNTTFQLDLIAAYTDSSISTSNQVTETFFSSAAKSDVAGGTTEESSSTQDEVDESSFEAIRNNIFAGLSCFSQRCVIKSSALPSGFILKFTLTASGPDGTSSDTFRVIVLKYVPQFRPISDLGIDPASAITVTPDVAEGLNTQVIISYSYLQAKSLTESGNFKSFKYAIEIFPSTIQPKDNRVNVFVPSDFPENTFIHVFQQVKEETWATVRFSITHSSGDNFVHERKIKIRPSNITVDNSTLFNDLKQQRDMNQTVDLTQLNTLSASLANQINKKKQDRNNQSTPLPPLNSTNATDSSDAQQIVDQDVDTKRIKDFQQIRKLSTCDAECPAELCQIDPSTNLGRCICPEGKYGESCSLSKEEFDNLQKTFEDITSLLMSNQNTDPDTIRQKTSTIQTLSQIKDLQSKDVIKNITSLIDETANQADDPDALREILFSISNIRDTVTRDHLAGGIPNPSSATGFLNSTKPNSTTSGTQNPPPSGTTTTQSGSITPVPTSLNTSNALPAPVVSTPPTGSAPAAGSTIPTGNSTNSSQPVYSPKLTYNETQNVQETTDRAIQNVASKIATTLDDGLNRKITIKEGQIGLDVTRISRPDGNSSVPQNASIRLQSDFGDNSTDTTNQVNIEFDFQTVQHFSGQVALQITSHPKEFDSAVENYQIVCPDVDNAVDFKFLDDNSDTTSTSSARILANETSTNQTQKSASIGRPKVPDGKAITIEIPRNPSQTTQLSDALGNNTTKPPVSNTTNTSASLPPPPSVNTSLPVLNGSSAFLPASQLPSVASSALPPKNGTINNTHVGSIVERMADNKTLLIRECRSKNESTGLFEQNCNLTLSDANKYVIKTNHFTKFVVAEYKEVDPVSDIIENMKPAGFDFYQSKAFYLFLAIIIVFGISMIIGLITDVMSTNSTLVYPMDSEIPITIPSELRCIAMIQLRNPVRLITLTTPKFSRFFRILFYFTYIFFIYGVSGQLSQHIALFIAVAVIGGVVGVLINLLKGFYVSSCIGQVFSIFLCCCGIAIDATLMRLSPGFTNEDDNNIWMMNAVLAILFDIIISDTIRSFLTLCAHSSLKSSPFANYFYDNQAVKAFIEKNVVKPATPFDVVKQNQSFSVLDQSQFRAHNEMTPIRTIR